MCLVEGTNTDILAADTQWLCEEILDDGGEILGWKEMETCGKNALKYALPYMCSSVNHNDDYITPIQNHKELINIAYNKNALLPRFAIKSAIGLSIVCRPLGPISFTEVLKDIYSICDWMQFEVIFYKPCDSLRDRIMSSVGRLEMGTVSGRLLKMESGDDSDEDDQDALLNVRTILSCSLFYTLYFLCLQSNFKFYRLLFLGFITYHFSRFVVIMPGMCSYFIPTYYDHFFNHYI
uniref:Macro domain-containing protein n=1 Tax=Heterorhabditis bacteriophora TaxID=37862 RepID=A0A1I7XI09_HETBA